MIGREFFNYIIESKIGDGGMAVVYKARHKSLDNTYRAIKMLNPVLAMDPAIRAKFKTEAQTMATLNHSNIVKVENYTEQGNELCLIMEYIEGYPLDFMLRNVTGPLPEPRIKTIFSAALDGFAYAHAKGIIHRDIKPSNIIISSGDVPKIIDFGIVKILEDSTAPGNTKTGTRIGTPMFMSPEQIHARPVDKRSDIYALGVTLFYMLTGRSPYNSDTHSEFEILQMVVNDPLPKAKVFYPAVSSHMQALVDVATQKKKEDRFNDCAQFKTALLDNSFTGGCGYNPPAIRTFNVSSTAIKKGEAITISWDISGLENAQIKGLGQVSNKQGSVVVAPIASTTYTLIAGGEQKAIYVDVVQPNSSKARWVWLGAIALVGLIVWGIIANSKGKVNNNFVDSDTSLQANKDSVANANTSSVTNDNFSTDTSSAMMPDSSSNPNTATTIKEYDNEAVNKVIKSRTASYNGSISEFDLDDMMSHFAPVVYRYYAQHNVEKEKLRTFSKDYFTKSIRQSRWILDTQRSNFSKNDDNTFNIDLYGDYYIYYVYTTTKFDPNKEYHLFLHNYYKLNSSYQIIEEYAIQRTEVNYN